MERENTKAGGAQKIKFRRHVVVQQFFIGRVGRGVPKDDDPRHQNQENRVDDADDEKIGISARRERSGFLNHKPS
jgi:hypothetical protein